MKQNLCLPLVVTKNVWNDVTEDDRNESDKPEISQEKGSLSWKWNAETKKLKKKNSHDLIFCYNSQMFWGRRVAERLNDPF